MSLPAHLELELLNRSTAESAARSLLANPVWLVGPPSSGVLSVVGDPSYDPDSPVISLALAWDAGEFVPAIIGALDAETEIDRRRRFAWILKQLAPLQAVEALLARAESREEDRIVRRYLLEGISPLAFAGLIDWSHLKRTIRLLVQDPDPGIREAATALAGMGDDCAEERRSLLLGMLVDPDVSVIAVSATALKRFVVREYEIEPGLLARLGSHENAAVRLSIEDLLSNKKN